MREMPPVSSATNAERTASSLSAARVVGLDVSKDPDEELAEDDEVAYSSGIKMRDLGADEVHQFPGLKREHWW